MSTDCQAYVATALQPGAIGIMQLIGDVEPVLNAVTGRANWPVGRMRLANLAGIDEGLAVRLAPTVAQLMPHGGPRVMQRVTAHLASLGVELVNFDDPSVDPMQQYPEAEDEFEALMLRALARAQSSLAIDLLLDQPRRWRELLAVGGNLSEEDRRRSTRLMRLIDPPMVVLAGLPNVGKSTVSNALLGRAMSIELDQPGTTRDYTMGLIDLAGLTVRWHDTPGIRDSDDPIEQRSIGIARKLIERADLLIAMRDANEGADVWPELPREPDLRIVNKCDLIENVSQKPRLTSRPAPLGLRQETSARKTGVTRDSIPMRISARTGSGLVDLVAVIRDRIVPPDDLADPGPWLFDDRLLPLAASRR